MTDTTGQLSRRVAWSVLVAIGAFLTIGAVFDLASDLRGALPGDHVATFQALTGLSWRALRSVPHSAAPYASRVESAYAVYELLFALIFLLLAAVPLRRRERWAWWGCWLVLGEFAGFAILFGTHDPANQVVAAGTAAVTSAALLLLRPRRVARARVGQA